MVRFQCIHCGARIAVPDDHMGRLARCPECGGITHPLAEHLSGPEGSGESSATKNPRAHAATFDRVHLSSANGPSDATHCGNCGEPLGKLQKPLEWDGHFVCRPCHRMLSLDKDEPAAGATMALLVRPEPTPAPAAPAGMAQGIVVEAPRTRPHASELSVALRTAVLGLFLTALALYLIVSILQSLGYLIVWGAVALAVLATVYWVRRGFMTLRRRGTNASAVSHERF